MDSQKPSPGVSLAQAFFVCFGGLFMLFYAGTRILVAHDSMFTQALAGGIVLVGIPAAVTLRYPHITAIILPLALAALLLGTGVGYVYISDDYNLAMSWMQEGRYEKAQGLFEVLEGFRDSTEKAVECENYLLYTEALESLDSRPESTYRALRKLKGFGPADEMLATPAMQTAREKSFAVGGYVTIGRYYEYSTLSTRPLSWKIIARDGDRALLVNYILEVQPFNETDQQVTWADCSLRQWMNNEFFHTIFTAEEQSVIETTQISIGDGSGSTTQDHLFLLSYSEVCQFFPEAYASTSKSFPDPEKQARIAAMTDYARKRYDNTSLSRQWLIRPVGEAGTTVPYIDHNGALQQDKPVSSPSGIRPAMWVVLDPDFF